MKKLITFLIIAYLSFTINSSAATQEKNLENKNILKIGVLLPLTGEFQDIGESFLKVINDYVRNNNIVPRRTFERNPKRRARHLSRTYQKTKEMVLKKFSIEEIAKLQDLKESRIEAVKIISEILNGFCSESQAISLSLYCKLENLLDRIEKDEKEDSNE